MRRPALPLRAVPVLPLVLLAGALACEGDTREADARLAPGEERGWTPGDPSGAPEAAAPAPAEPAPPAPAEEAPPAPPAEGAQARIARLEEELREAERAAEQARAKLEAAREALAEARAAAAGPARSDADLFREVQRRLLEDPALSRVAIRAEVTDGVVTLHGSVAEREIARAAGAVAASVDGVVRVESRIEVTGGG